MFLMDNDLIHDRRMVVQDVIDLTQANGKVYLEALKEFNKQFEKNPRNQILNEISKEDEQPIPFRAD
jgi:hypothetical protein